MWVLAAAVPLLFLLALRVAPDWDVDWEHHPSHFWMVGGVALAAALLGMALAEAASRREDARLFLVSLAFVVSAAFLGLHALATPGVILDEANGGFEAATPVGLFLAALFAAASAVDLSAEQSRTILRLQWVLRGVVGVLVVGWAIVSLSGMAPLDDPIDPDAFHPVLTPLAALGAGLFLVASLGYARLRTSRRSVLLAATIIAFVALGQAMVVGVFARNWRLSWWEWHVLMAAGFAFIAYSVWSQIRREGGRVGLFDSMALERTLREVRKDYSDALEALVAAMEERAATGDGAATPVTAGLGQRFDLTERQVAVLERAAEALQAERRDMRRLGGMVEAGRQARLIRGEDELLAATLGALVPGFEPDRIGVGLVRDRELVTVAGSTVEVDALDEPALHEGTTQEDATRGTLVVPLLVKDHPAGVLRVQRATGTIGERERSLAETLATQLATTVENARLYHQIDHLFRSYMSPDVATTLLADPDQAALGGATAEVSALMADVVSFTSFSERSTPQDVVAMLNAYLAAVVPEILAEGGTVTQFVGDAVVALFGAPARHGDHAARACRAALAFQVAAEGVRAEHPGWPQFRVGVNTGPALVGNIGSEEMRHYTAIGDTVNLAARLESAAPHGQVVISASTRAAVGDLADVEDFGELTVKGKEQVVRAYVLRSMSGGADA